MARHGTRRPYRAILVQHTHASPDPFNSVKWRVSATPTLSCTVVLHTHTQKRLKGCHSLGGVREGVELFGDGWTQITWDILDLVFVLIFILFGGGRAVSWSLLLSFSIGESFIYTIYGTYWLVSVTVLVLCVLVPPSPPEWRAQVRVPPLLVLSHFEPIYDQESFPGEHQG